MMDYRLYFMSGDGTHIDRVHALEAICDEDAIMLASGQTCTYPLELWQRARMIRHFDAVSALAKPIDRRRM